MVLFDADEMDTIEDAQLILAGIRPDDLDRMSDQQAAMVLVMRQRERELEHRFYAKLFGAEIQD